MIHHTFIKAFGIASMRSLSQIWIIILSPSALVDSILEDRSDRSASLCFISADETPSFRTLVPVELLRVALVRQRYTRGTGSAVQADKLIFNIDM